MNKKPIVITPDVLAERWGFSIHTLASWRKRGKGPKFYKKGYRSIVYKMDEIEEFEKENEGFLL